ncbi:unnamed protein product [Oppiella nova]|uniref:Uncharacterized protein n=1 Tax=Oppiella nova TaxID=334625 RepID=A0A7R9MAD9_9ACAR|nr:unnamed protein product [Oppiella nova]CAG2173753.1 unnamed protein product [Oppiella nova]
MSSSMVRTVPAIICDCRRLELQKTHQKLIETLNEFLESFREMDVNCDDRQKRQNILVFQLNELKKLKTRFDERKVFFDLKDSQFGCQRFMKRRTIDGNNRRVNRGLNTSVDVMTEKPMHSYRNILKDKSTQALAERERLLKDLTAFTAQLKKDLNLSILLTESVYDFETVEVVDNQTKS